MHMQNIHHTKAGSAETGALPIAWEGNKNTRERMREQWELKGGEHLNIGKKKAKQMLAAFSASFLFGMLSTFITLLHLVYSPCAPPSTSPCCLPSPPSFLHASRTLKSLHGAAPLRSNESVCCHFSDAWCEIKRAVYVRAVAGIKRQAHIGRRQLLQSLQAHIYVPFVQFAICSTKPIF